MASNRSRLDRFLSSQTNTPRKAVRALLTQNRVTVDGKTANDRDQLIDDFSHITLDGEVLQANHARYVMMNKPKGVVSATTDAHHTTAIDLLAPQEQTGLHIVGRLDFHSTGLLLMTNDSRWSSRLMTPEQKVSKRYRVKLAQPICEDTAQGFAEGLYFSYEGITTRPAGLTLLSEQEAEVTLTEGRYHQIKRMFARFNNKVEELHRVAIGNLELDSDLKPGDYRALTADEVTSIFDNRL